MLTDIQRKYLRHALQNQLAKLRTQYGGGNYLLLPTCPKCERLALRDKKRYDEPGNVYVTCPQCGYHGIGGPPMKMLVEEAHKS